MYMILFFKFFLKKTILRVFVKMIQHYSRMQSSCHALRRILIFSSLR